MAGQGLVVACCNMSFSEIIVCLQPRSGCCSLHMGSLHHPSAETGFSQTDFCKPFHGLHWETRFTRPYAAIYLSRQTSYKFKKRESQGWEVVLGEPCSSSQQLLKTEIITRTGKNGEANIQKCKISPPASHSQDVTG